MTNSLAIMLEGQYTVVAKNNIGHKIRETRNFTVGDGDTKQIDLVIPE
jgi:hypothetical protein